MLEVCVSPFDHTNYGRNSNFTDVNPTGLGTHADKHLTVNHNTASAPSPYSESNSSFDPRHHFGLDLCSTPEDYNLTISGDNWSTITPKASTSCATSQINRLLTKSDIGVTRNCSDFDSQTFEKLDVQSQLLEYLVRHHAISEESSNDILLKPACQRLPLLLSAIGFPAFDVSNKVQILQSSPPPGLALLLNGLRHSGHHEVANYLDFSRRITPSPFTNSAETDDNKPNQSPQRRRGQLSIWIQLLAIKVCPDLYNELSNQLNSKYSATDNNRLLPSCVEGLQSNKFFADCSSSKRRSSNSPAVWIESFASDYSIVRKTSLTKTNRDVEPRNSVYKRHLWSYLFCCFKGLRKRTKSCVSSSIAGSQPDGTPLSQNEINNSYSQTLNCIEPPTVIKNSNMNNNNTNSLPNIVSAEQALLETKSEQFNKFITDSGSVLHDAVVKYLEQSSGVLVLDCKVAASPVGSQFGSVKSSGHPSLCVVTVATQHELIKRLSEACALRSSNVEIPTSHPPTHGYKFIYTSKLADDLTSTLIHSGILECLQLQNLLISVTLDAQEVQLAIDELAE